MEKTWDKDMYETFDYLVQTRAHKPRPLAEMWEQGYDWNSNQILELVCREDISGLRANHTESEVSAAISFCVRAIHWVDYSIRMD